jgi:ubiquinone/menaquinone biosynthesis C-methylase UbiE
MSIKRHKRDWEEMARADPLWAISSVQSRRYGRWDLQEFFASGEAEIAEALGKADELGLPRERDEALDFGCGVGRTTRALARRFRECVGVDISAAMVTRARQLEPKCENCRFIVNDAEHLHIFPPRMFDMVYSSLVLQHLPNMSMARGYIGEFLRVLRPEGLAVFQLPHLIPFRNRWQLRRRLYSMLRSVGFDARYLYNRAGLNPIRMISMTESQVRYVVEQRGGVIVLAQPIDEPEQPIKSTRYYARLAGG